MTNLSSHLIAKPQPQTSASQIISGEGYRISVLTDRLFRVEVSPTNTFVDGATQFAWYRSFAKPEYKVSEADSCLTITTSAVSLLFNKTAKSAKTIVFSDGRKVPVGNAGNLKGTARTLDMSMGKVKLGDGIISRTGVAVLEDKGLPILPDGGVAARTVDTKDYYIFAYGNDYRGAVQDFYKLTGEVPLIPRFALGNWWSRYKAYTQQEYVDLMQRFIDEDIPITVATIDMDWHWVDINKKFGTSYPHDRVIMPSGWTGYSWNTDLFPDYKGFLKWLKDQNLKVTVNLHPAAGVRSFEDMYPEMAKAMGVDPATKQDIPFDITSPEYINAYFKVLHKPYERDGVDFWWIDWQQGYNTKIKGLDPLWALNHYHTLDNALKVDGTTNRPLILSRYAGIGSHRYPLGFSGDTHVLWSSLKFQPYFTLNAANIGYTWWSHDIGGHMMGKKDDEMYLRWLQFGVFSPINRLHSTANELMGKEPWKFRKDTELYTKDLLRLRHALIPYIYTMNYRTHKEGIALCEPMYYTYPNTAAAYTVKNQYMFGSELMVCPITSKADKKSGMAKVKVWLPKGRWTDIFNGRVYEGDRYVNMYRDTSSIPVLAKEGAIVPLGISAGNESGVPDKLELWVYRGNSEFNLYEDRGDDMSYTTDYAITKMRTIEDGGFVLEIDTAEGDLSVLPEKRDITVCFRDLVGGTVTVVVNDTVVPAEVSEKTLKVHLKAIKPTDKVYVAVENYVTTANPSVKEYAIEVLSKLQGSNVLKGFAHLDYSKLDGEDAAAVLDKSFFSARAKDIIKEIM